MIVKAISNPFAPARARWAAAALPVLAGRGYPVPEVAWHGQLDERWFLVVHARLPGQPLDMLDASTVEDLVALVELQTGLGTVGGGWDVSWWISAVLFEGWEHWWGGGAPDDPVNRAPVREGQRPCRRASRGFAVPRRRAPDASRTSCMILLGLNRIAHYAPDHAEHLAGRAVIDGFEGDLIPAGHMSEHGAKLTVPRRRGAARGFQ